MAETLEAELIEQPHGGALRPPQRKGDPSPNPTGINRWTKARESSLDQLVAVAESIVHGGSEDLDTRMRVVWEQLFLLAENGDVKAITLIAKMLVPDVDKLMAAALSNPGTPLRAAVLPMNDERRAKLASMGLDIAREIEEERAE